MKKSDNFFQKLFGGIGLTGSSRVPLRSNVFNQGKGYSPIGQTGRASRLFGDRQSPLLGNAQPSNRLSGYYERVAELKSYQLLDITKLAVGLFRDYLTNFITKDGQEIITISDDEGNNDNNKSERINNILTKDLKIINYIKNHLDDKIFFGTYGSMLKTFLDDTGHTKFRFEELYDPVSTVIKKKKNKEGEIEEICLTRGDDGVLYEIPKDEYFILGATDLRLINDLDDDWKDKTFNKPSFSKKNNKEESNREKVIRKESYSAGEPIFYSLVLKIKELVIKELLISLISLRDLASPSLYGLAIDKGVSMETANDLCARVQKLSTNYTELASFLTAQFDATSFIENALTQNIKFFPDFNGTVSNKNSLLPLDKLGEKLLELMQTLDQCRQNILSPLGIPSSIFDSASGSKWSILQQSERANSRVASMMAGIQESVINLTCSIHKLIYNEDIDPANIKVHIFEKSTVEYNNQINQSESINSLMGGITQVLQNAIQTLEGASPLIDPEKFLNYVQNQLKNIDPGAYSFITEDTIRQYLELLQAKMAAQMEQIQSGMA